MILAPKKIVCHCFHFSPKYLPWKNGTGFHDFSVWMLSFKPSFSLSSFTFIKRLFRSICKTNLLDKIYNPCIRTLQTLLEKEAETHRGTNLQQWSRMCQSWICILKIKRSSYFEGRERPHLASDNACAWVFSCLVVSSSLWPLGLWPRRFLFQWDFQARILEWVAVSYLSVRGM